MKMKSLLNRSSRRKILLSFHKFVSSMAFVENPLCFDGNNVPNPTSFDIFHFIRDYSKSKHYSLKNTQLLHSYLLKGSLLQTHMFFMNSLLDWYCKSGSMGDALKMFETIPQPNVISWNTLISGFSQNSLFGDSWNTFRGMLLLGYQPNEITYGSLLSACTVLQAPLLGQLVYSLAIKNGFFSNGYVRSGIIDLFSKNGSFEDALRVFYDVGCENVVCWNAIISGAVKNEENRLALVLFQEMHRGFLVPNPFTISSVLTACAILEELNTGKMLQGLGIKCATQDVFLGTAIIDLYAKCGDMNEAVQEFSRMPICNVVSWTAMISGFVTKDDSEAALNIFKKMRHTAVEINSYTVTTVITACAKPAMVGEAIQIHSWILKSGFCMDPVVVSALINMYSKAGAIDLWEMMFKDVEHVQNPQGIWAVMISSSAQNQGSQRTIEIFKRMQDKGIRADMFCSSSLLSVIVCSRLGRQIHSYTLKTGLLTHLSVSSSLFTMYSKCGCINDSFKVFEQIPVKDNVSWNSMIAGFAENGCARQAVGLFRKMLSLGAKPDQLTLAAALTSVSFLHSLQKGQEIHGYALRAGVVKETLVASALVVMYSKCNALNLAKKIFDVLPQKDQISYSSLVSGYAQNGLVEEALILINDMRISDLGLDSFTVSSVIGALDLSQGSDVGTQLHACITKIGLDAEASVGSSLVTMYSKCGGIEDCCKAFDQINETDLVAWTSLIASYAWHGKGREALKLYDLMRNEGIQPDSVTFVGVLSACSHSGLVEDAYFHLNSMEKEYNIKPCLRHYACMVDLLGRSGRLREAENFINKMPIEPDSLIWGTLLAACKVHGDVEIGKLAAEKVFRQKPCDAGAYVSLSNMFAELGEWDVVEDIRDLMKGSGVNKEPGWSFV